MTDKNLPEKYLQEFKTVTLGELGNSLPIGFEIGSKLEKAFSSRPWRFKEEKELGKIREEKKGLTLGEFVSHMLGLMMIQVGPHNFDNLKISEKRLLIAQSYLADVMYMYIFLRREALGPDVVVKLNCPICRAESNRKFNLNDLDVRIIEDSNQLIKDVELRDGLKIFGENRKVLQIRPPKWMVMEKPGMTSNNEALRRVELFKNCVVGAEGVKKNRPIAIIDDDLDEMSKYDIELLTSKIENSPGPQMAIEMECLKCRQTSFQMIEWHYEAFFSSFSQSITGKN